MQADLDAGHWLGPLAPLFEQEDVSEIMVLDYDRVYVERLGHLESRQVSFPSRQALLELVERLLVPLGRELTQALPFADGRLGQRVRFTATIPPLTSVPTLTIRRDLDPNLDRAWLETLDGDDRPLKILASWVRQRRNVIVAGASGSGKTSLLRRLAHFVPGDQRIVTIEETRELALELYHPHVLALETRTPNRTGRYGIDTADAIRLALHLRPDRIVVGEVRGAEAFSWLAALDSGHPGGLTTVHANSASDVPQRLLYAMAQAHSAPLPLLRARIDELIGGVVHLHRAQNGSRRPTQLLEWQDGRPKVVWP